MRLSRLKLRGAAWGSFGHVIFFRGWPDVAERLGDSGVTELAGCYLGQIGCQGDGLSRQDTQVIYDS